MLYAVLADIHGNLEALRAVLAEIERSGAERLVCLGDLVGYGADPRKCVDTMRDLEATVVAGNHDWAAVDKLSTAYFNADARDSISWTRDRLSPARSASAKLRPSQSGEHSPPASSVTVAERSVW